MHNMTYVRHECMKVTIRLPLVVMGFGRLRGTSGGVLVCLEVAWGTLIACRMCIPRHQHVYLNGMCRDEVR